MAEGCPHVKQVRLASDKSFLNPRTWTCCECGTTDSVWACLLCSHVACGRGCSQHALKHFDQTKHPIAIEVNLRHVHCYLCDDYILNDNSTGDIALAQSLLGQVASQHYQESCTRSGKVIKLAATFMRSKSRVEENISKKADRRYTALCHWKYLLLSRAFNTWRLNVAEAKQQRSSSSHAVSEVKVMAAPRKRKRLLTPGMTGLRNLGNTCYMNAVLQSLGHLVFFRECFRQLAPPQSGVETTDGLTPAEVLFNRQTTVECFQHISSRPPRRSKLVRQVQVGGLSGGAGGAGGRGGKCLREASEDGDEQIPSLCQEMHRLMRVMWSGKWAVVTPHAVLNAIWRLIPSFHGYTQQDAQEFLCELLERLQSELDEAPHTHVLTLSTPYRDVALPHEVLPNLFQGKVVSEVSYEACGHCSRVEEVFWGLPLDFPEKYLEANSQPHNRQTQKTAQECPLEELLSKFTETEPLEGTVYTCEKCAGNCNSSRPLLQSARKRLSITSPPDVLRLHLKRFRWSGRRCHKINTHVRFPLVLDLESYCSSPPPSGRTVTFLTEREDFAYQLSSIIIHHGVGFASGHYTSYCWNSEADSWVHCNDNRISRCSLDTVLSCQAYMLFYVRIRGRSSHPQTQWWVEQECEWAEPVAKRQKQA